MTQNRQNPKKPASGTKSEARRQRQAAALRANLRRRKAGDRPAADPAAPPADAGDGE